MNIQQRNYAKAKAIYDTLEAEAAKIEQDYIGDHKIANPDGSIPERIYCIDDQAVFDEANEATASAIDVLGLSGARKILREAEDDLIRFGLSLAPAKEREILMNRCFGLHGHTMLLKVRDEVINLAFKLDVSTVRA